jgi:hypothetical protein
MIGSGNESSQIRVHSSSLFVLFKVGAHLAADCPSFRKKSRHYLKLRASLMRRFPVLCKHSKRKLAAQLFVLGLIALMSLSVLSGSSVLSFTPADMVGRWSADGNADDSIGANNGVLRGSVAYATGKSGRAFSFDGNSFVEVANSLALESPTITVTAWVKSLGSPGAYRYVLAKGLQNCDASSYGLYTGENGGLSFYVYDGNTYSRSPARGPEIWDGSWHYVAGTYDGANVRLYVDGQEFGRGTSTTISINYGLTPDQKFYLGAQSEFQNGCGATTNFIGDVDEVKIWNRALSDSEIHDDFESGALNAVPLANDQNVTTNEDTAKAIILSASDTDNDSLTYSVVTGPSHGVLSGTTPDLSYTPAANYYGSDTFTFKANDGTVDSNASVVTITIVPVNDPPVAVSDSYSVAQANALTVATPGVLSNDTDIEGDQLTVMLVTGPAHGTLSLNTNGSFTYTPLASYTGSDGFTYRAIDSAGDSDIGTVDFVVATRTATTSTLTVSKSPQQYSDPVTFEATITPLTIGGPPPALSVTFKVGTQLIGTAPMVLQGTAYKGKLTAPLLEPTPFGTGPTGQMKPTPLGRTATAVFNDVSPFYSVANATRSMMISKEDARAAYSGQTIALTACATCTTTTVTLSATIQDISATLYAIGDTDSGDIRHATVTFVDRDTGASISPLLSVALINPNDNRTGTVRYNWTVNLGLAEAQTFRVGILVDPNYYVRFSSSDDALVTVAKPLPTGFITAGGNLIMSNSAGLKSGEAGTLNDFSIGIQYRGNGSNPTGDFSSIVRSRVSGALRVYQIKGSRITSLVVSGNKATIRGNASIYDITNGSFLVDANATFEVSITDAGEFGMSDSLAITVRDSANALWFSSNWNGVKTGEQLLGGGDIKVR